MAGGRVVAVVALLSILLPPLLLWTINNADSAIGRSVAAQSVRYFGRANDAKARLDDVFASLPVSPGHWLAVDLRNRESEWLFRLGEDEVTELRQAVAQTAARNVTLQQMTKDDLHVPLLSRRFAQWRRALSPRHGMGVVIIKGVPVSGWTEREREVFWWAFGLHLGAPGAQNSKGDLLGKVTNEFTNAAESHAAVGKVRQYRTNEAIHFHCDVAEVVGLLCIQPAESGGESRIVSTVAVINELSRTHPEVVPTLFKKIPLDTRGDGDINWMYITPSAYYDGILRTFWHSDYFVTSFQYKDSPLPTVPQDVRDLVKEFDRIANDPKFSYDMVFEPGDIQLISNHVVAHARTEFNDNESKNMKRNVLRLWLTLSDEDVNFKEVMLKGINQMQFLIDVALRKLHIT